MKTQNAILISMMLIAFLTATFTAFSQDKKFETLKIKTSAVCDMCKDRIEQGMSFEKGIKTVVLDVPTKTLTLTYNPAKTTPDAMRKAVSKLGYDADDIAADKSAYNKLPACCKKEAAK